jgi:hypothetical protein
MRGFDLLVKTPKKAEIEGFISGANNVDSRTMGWGMTFMHELMHTALFNGLKDPQGMFSVGGPEVELNQVRQELNSNGFDFGQRLSYRGYPAGDSGKAFIPFDDNAKKSLRDDQVEPDKSSKFVSYTPRQ